MSKQNMKSMNFFVSQELSDMIIKHAENTGMTKSNIIRRALKQFLEGKVSE